MPARPPALPTASRLFPVAFGALLGLALVKFGNPVILSSLVEWPEDPWQWVFFAWPVVVAYPLLLAVLALGFWELESRGFGLRAVVTHVFGDQAGSVHGAPASGPASSIPGARPVRAGPESGAPADWAGAGLRVQDLRRPALWLPLVWIAWQFIAATGTVDHRLTQWTLCQFAAAVLCFYLGYASLGGARRLTGFWTALLACFAVVLVTGLEQHFGGLAASREHFLLYVKPGMKEVPPELMKRMTSGRIFGTLFYPNTLATVILLLLPALLAFLWSLKASLTVGARLFLMASLALAALACLVWSGSKGGWLVMLLLGLVALLQMRFPRRWKLTLVGLVLVAGLAGFFWRYAAFFEKGATSVGARFDYWQAAAQTVRDHPLLGSGPGTFGVVYARVKRPDAEMSRMTHNDYLQQGSDSGVPGLLAYCGFVVLALLGGFPRGIGAPDWPRLAVWLGVLGWAVQSLFEFPLYIPATAWLPFALLGWLLREQALRSSRLGG